MPLYKVSTPGCVLRTGHGDYAYNDLFEDSEEGVAGIIGQFVREATPEEQADWEINQAATLPKVTEGGDSSIPPQAPSLPPQSQPETPERKRRSSVT